jgi:hypothetical protein
VRRLQTSGQDESLNAVRLAINRNYTDNPLNLEPSASMPVLTTARVFAAASSGKPDVKRWQVKT